MKAGIYLEYKDSYSSWLGMVPLHWNLERLKRCVTIINGKVDGNTSELPYTGLEHVESWTGRLVESDEKPTSEGQCSHFKEGDVLFGKLRPYLAKVVRAQQEGICTGELFVLRPRKISQDYLFYYMVARDFIQMVDSSTYGAKMPRANWDFVGNLQLLIPPFDEQHTIAAFLDRETERIDSLIAKKQRQIELLNEKRGALISRAVTRGLNPDARMKHSGVEWLGEIPEHWQVERFKYVLALPLQYGANESAEYEEPSWPRYVRITDVDEKGNLRKDTFKTLPEDIARPYLLKHGDFSLLSG